MKTTKRILCAALGAVTALSVCTGCKNTQAPAADLSQTEPAVSAQAGGAGFLSAMEVPERFTGDWTGVDGLVTVHMDATVSLPKTDAIPTAAVERRFFTQEEADRLREAFTKCNPFYEEQLTKQYLQPTLERYYAMERGELPIDLDGGNTKEVLEQYIENVKAAIEKAPDDSERIPADTTLRPDPKGTFDEQLTGWSEVDGNRVYIRITNDSNFGITTQALAYREGYGYTNGCYCVDFHDFDNPPELSMTEADAIAMGDALMTSLGQESMVCEQIMPVVYTSGNGDEHYPTFHGEPSVLDSGYEMRYVRTVNGFPIAYTGRGGSATPDNEDIESWAYEEMTIYAAKDGIVYFYWMNPYTEPVVQTPDTALMDFGDIQDIFTKMIMVTNEDLKAQNSANGFVCLRNIDVYNVRLHLMRIRDKYNTTEGTLVPVWDFYGINKLQAEDRAYSKYVYEDGYDEIVLTLNAVDGTVIDRDLGY
ncbi:MAG: DUF6034 family protein [Faecousia sp.]